jgi:hypothetical protein
MASPFIARALVSSAILILCWCGQPKAFAKDKCQTFVKYSERSVDVSFPTFKAFSLGKLSEKPTPIQVASDMAQLFDFYQYTTCDQLNKLNPKDPKYEDTVRERMQATDRLTASIVLLMLLRAADGNPSSATKPSGPSSTTTKEESDYAEFVGQSVLAARVALAASDTQDGKAILKSRNQWRFDQGRIEAALKEVALKNNQARNSTSSIRPWELIPKQKRETIVEHLKEIVWALKGPLNNFDEDKLRTYVWMPAGDGHLQVPDQPTLATHGPYPRLDHEGIKIPIGYGFTGVAYEQKREQYGCLPGEGVKVEFTMGLEDGAEETQRRARRVLLEADYISQPTAQWIIAVPLKNSKNEVVAVLSVSSDQKPKGFPEDCNQPSWHEWEVRLKTAYQENSTAIHDAVQKIEDLLTPSSADVIPRGL